MARPTNERRVAEIVDDYMEEVLTNQNDEDIRANPEPWMAIWMDMERMKDPD